MQHPKKCCGYLPWVDLSLLTSIPMKLRIQHPTMRFVYLILPLRKYGHASLANSAGTMLQKAMTPFEVDGGTRSSAAERMIM